MTPSFADLAPTTLPVPPVPAASLPLAATTFGRTYRVVAVDGGDTLAQRLVAAGLWTGAVIERLRRAPFGDPLLFRVHGFRIALRVSEASRVRVVESS